MHSEKNVLNAKETTTKSFIKEKKYVAPPVNSESTTQTRNPLNNPSQNHYPEEEQFAQVPNTTIRCVRSVKFKSEQASSIIVIILSSENSIN